MLRPDSAPDRGQRRHESLYILAGAVLLVGTAALFALSHQDDLDALVYTVVTRHLVEDGTPWRLRYVPPLDPFYEHPPFWFWVLGAIRSAAPWLPLGIASVACTLGTALATFSVGRRVVGARAAAYALILLAFDHQFARHGGLPRLDAPLVLAFTASIALLLEARGRAALLLLGGLLAGLGALVKGPPALGAPAAAALMLLLLGRGSELRAARSWLLVLTGALVPIGAFLLWDALRLESAWMNGYLSRQVLASLDGRRTTGGQGPLFLLLAGPWARFKVGTLLAGGAVLFAVVRWRDSERLRVRLALVAWAAVVIVGYGLASRAYWFYTLPAFVPVALLAGAAVDDLVTSRAGAVRSSRFAAGAAWIALAVGAVLLVAAPFGAGALLTRPCPLGDLPGEAARLSSGRGRAVAIGAPHDWPLLAIASEHARQYVELVPDLADAARRPDTVAILVPTREARDLPGWVKVQDTREWSLLVREGHSGP